LAALYEQIATTRGGVAEIHQAQSLNVRAPQTHLELYKAIIFQPSSLPRAWRERIAVEVSRANGCAYCVAHHQATLDSRGPAEEPTAELAWAARLTREPAAASEDDLLAQRTAGLDDRAVLDASLTVSYSNDVYRLVRATGLELEANFTEPCQPDRVEPARRRHSHVLPPLGHAAVHTSGPVTTAAIRGPQALPPCQDEGSFAARPDLELVDCVLRGREEAFVALVERYQGTLLRIARTYVRDDALAEDVVQDTWIGFLKGIHRFEGRSSFRTWLFRVLSNRARTRAVREARYVPMDEDGDAHDQDGRFTEAGAWRVPPREWRITPERLALSDEVRCIVLDALAALPANQRSVVELRDLQGLAASEVRTILGLTDAHQRVLLHRGRTKVRAALAAQLELP
jgi:RNA polymerase sigma-70 factor (ECF subfamily)